MDYKVSNVIGFIVGFISLIIVNVILSLAVMFILIKIPQLTVPIFSRYLGEHFSWSVAIYWIVQALSGFIGGKICYSICKEKYTYQHKPGCIVLEIVIGVISIITIVLSVINGNFTWNTIVTNVAVCCGVFVSCNGDSFLDIFDS